MKKALGILETYGLLAGVAAADAMVKAANVELVGYELSRGQGMAVIKVTGNVGAVKAAVACGEAVAREMGLFRGKDIIARPADNLELMIFNTHTVGREKEKETAEPENTPGQEPDIKQAIEQEPEAEQIIEQKPELIVEQEQELIVEQEPEEIVEQQAAEREQADEPQGTATCNLCNDPACPRKPRQPHKMCIHITE